MQPTTAVSIRMAMPDAPATGGVRGSAALEVARLMPASALAFVPRRLVVGLEPGALAAGPHVEGGRDPLRVVQAGDRDADVVVLVGNGADRGAAGRAEPALEVGRGAIIGRLVPRPGEALEREVDP